MQYFLTGVLFSSVGFVNALTNQLRYARRKLSWGRGQTDELLLPMMKRRSKAIQVIFAYVTKFFDSYDLATVIVK